MNEDFPITYLARHGETAWSLTGQHTGLTDLPLTEHGELNARSLKNRLCHFDVFVEYAKADPEDILIRITVANRGPETATLRVLPTLWFRDIWTGQERPAMPSLRAPSGEGICAILAYHPELGERWLHIDKATTLLFTENATNTQRLFNQPNSTPYVKDAFDQYVVKGNKEAVNPEAIGTKAAADFTLRVAAGASEVVNLLLSNRSPAQDSFESFDSILKQRQAEADDFTAPSRRRRPPKTKGESCGSRWPACRGPISISFTTSTNG